MIYKTIQAEDRVDGSQTLVTTGLWTGDTGSLKDDTLFFLNDQINNSGEYYLNVYDTDISSDETAEVQFAISYGHVNGGGAPTLLDNDEAKLPTKAIYSQYRNLLLDPTDAKFSFNDVQSDHIYVINFNRSRYREQLDPGNWQLPLSGANGLFTFVDNSNDIAGQIVGTSRAGRVYDIVSGSFTTTGATTGLVTASNTYNGIGFGKVYPDLGIMVLNPDAICPLVGFYVSGSNLDLTVDSGAGVTGSAMLASQGAVGQVYTLSNVPGLDAIAGAATASLPFAPLTGSVTESLWGANKSAFNHAGLYVSIRKALQGTSEEFRARSAETISSSHFFIRLRNNEFNYSNNPTFRDSNNNIRYSSFRRDPVVYVTTVGLYNDNNELLAVAKLSKPVRKTFNEEILLRVRLDY